MENESRFQQWLSKVGEKLNEQVWFQQLRSKWDELDPQSRMYLKYAALAASVLLVLGGLFTSIWSVSRLKSELREKSDLLNVIQTANEELRRLRETTPGAASGGRPGEQNAAPWPSYFQSTAQTAGIDQAALNVGSEKQADAGAMASETLFDLNLKHVNIKQVVRYAFHLENGARPVKLRNLTIDTNQDPEGYLDATLSVSAFTMKQ